MADKKHIDKDAVLVETYGKYLSGEGDFSSKEDPLVLVLKEYKETMFTASDLSRKQEVWAELQKKISATSRVYALPGKQRIRYWAAAATVLIAGLIGWGIYDLEFRSITIAESYSTIQTLNLADGTEITLRPYSRLTQKGKRNVRNYQLEGEAYFNVAHNEDQAFSVRTEHAMVRVIGTRFNLREWGGRSVVYLEEGSVQFDNLNTGEHLVLKPGQAATVQGKEPIQLESNADSLEYLDWKQNQMIFKDKTLEDLITELEHHFNITITIPQELAQEKLSGGLTLESARQSLNYLSLTLDGYFEEISDTEYRFVANHN